MKKYFLYGFILINIFLNTFTVEALFRENNGFFPFLSEDINVNSLYPAQSTSPSFFQLPPLPLGSPVFFSSGAVYPLFTANNTLFNPISLRRTSSITHAPINTFFSPASNNFLINSLLGPFTPFLPGSQLQSFPIIDANFLINQRGAKIVTPAPVDVVPVYTYTVINTYPHDRTAFTQGLVFENGFLYEGTGIIGRSSLRKVELETGTVLQLRELPSPYFGEGITIYGNRIIQLTWLSQVGFVYDKNTFELLQEFNYVTEGWGITHDGKRLIMSDGTARLHFLDPVTFEETGWLDVYDPDGPVTMLNELEYIQGEIYANVWLTDRIARISPLTGQVTGWIDLAGLLSPDDLVYPVNVLNGIAYNPITNRLLVTGKLWPQLFEIELIPLPVL